MKVFASEYRPCQIQVNKGQIGIGGRESGTALVFSSLSALPLLTFPFYLYSLRYQVTPFR
jgi:hypothetical protein